MPKKTNLNLPFNFRNVGDQQSSRSNLQKASPLGVEVIVIPHDIIVRANLEGKMHSYEGLPACQSLAHLLRKEYPHMKLWEVEVHNTAVHLHLFNSLPGASAKHAIACKIMVENCGFLEMEFTAQTFGSEPGRLLHCQFGHDAEWGRFVDLTEWRAGYGARKAVIYPQARTEHFRKIREH